jgi:hypothetical protein
MTENSVRYDDAIDGSTLTVKPVAHANFEGYLRFETEDAPDELPAAVDLTRADVQSLIQYAQQWLEDTKPKPPTTPGSVVRIPRDVSVADIILTRLNENGKAALELAPSLGLWVSQYGTFWTDGEIVGEAGDRFEVIHDAGKSE